MFYCHLLIHSEDENDYIFITKDVYDHLKNWLNQWLSNDLFSRIMIKHKQWQPDADIVYFP